ncbi:MAG TPA: hypothetical protein VH328_09305 [Burkholderiaceae bacterium]|jgi:hypothetical protein|nr:hypothetical protein [Burkholderiaceae bacterium]
MLRGLVLLFVGINVALYFWLRADHGWGQAEREPGRMAHQVSPSAIQVLPELPPSAAGAGTPAESAPSPAASAA